MQRFICTSLIWALDYEYNASGMITNKAEILGNGQEEQVAYTYDSIDRLVGESRTAGFQPASSIVYTYDLAGNRTSVIENGATNTYTLGTGNRLVKATSPSLSRTFSYDDAGNTEGITNIQQGTPNVEMQLGWDERYRLTSVVQDSVFDIQYSYDVLNRRVSRTAGDSPATVEYYVYDGPKRSADNFPPGNSDGGAVHQVVADLDGSGNLLRTYVWGQGIDNLLAMTVYPAALNSTTLTISTPLTLYPIKDHQNSILALVDASGTVVESYEYDAYGNPTVYDASGSQIANNRSQISNRYTFQGREIDWVTGLYYFRARWYDPETGRWISKDPKGIAGGLNLYVAFENNPVNSVDPTGHCAKKGTWNPSGHAVIWKGGKIGFFAIAGVEIGSITLKFDNGYFQDYRYISSGVGVGFSLAFDLGGDVYGVYSPSDYTGSFWNTDVGAGYSYGTSWWGDTANDSHSMGSVGATATYQGYWTSGEPYQ